MDKRSSRDLLSNLPLNIINTILENVSIKDAARTCILSRQWRYKWASLPHLTFDAKSPTSSNEIYKVLLFHQGPILKFKLNLKHASVTENLNPWLTFLSRNGIRVLILYSSVVDLDIPTSIYSCQNLTHLELYNCDICRPPPTFKGFSCLRRLVLENICAIQCLLSDLNLLEELRLLDVYRCRNGGNMSFRIHAPNLKILHLKGGFQYICLYAPLLSHMCADFSTGSSTVFAPPRTTSLCTYTEVLGSLTALEELKGSLHFFEFLSAGIESCHTPLVFPHLRFIELTPNVFYDKKVQSVMDHICKGAPNLHKIRVSYMLSSHMRLISTCMDSECPFNFTFERLKVIEFVDQYVGGFNRYMKLIKCLLARSPALETMICVRPFMSDSELTEQAFTLLTYPRASPNAKIVFK